MTELDNLTPDLPEPQPMTPEELARYRELLSLAYPRPKRDIRSAVMAQIQEETAAGTKILTPKKKNLRKAVLRWGSLAACAALVVLIGVSVLPNRLMKTADSAVPEYAVAEEAALVYDEAAPAEIAGDADSAEGGAAVGNSAPAEKFGFAPAAIAPEEDAVFEDACEEETVAEEACKEEAEAPMEAPAPEPAVTEAACATANEAADMTVEKSLMASPAVSDDAHHCEYSGAFRDSYHFIPLSLISLVGEEAYAEWEGKLETCVNLPDFAIAFGLTAEEIWNVGNLWYYVDLPEDIPLTEENRDAIREYYRNGGNYAEMVRRYTEYEYKNALISLVGVTEYTRWAAQWSDGASLRSWTADDLARDFGLTDDQLRAAYDKAAAKVAAEYPGDGIPPYDKLVGE